MKLQIKKSALKRLSDTQQLAQQQTPNVAGGLTYRCNRPPQSETGNRYWACEC
ncbi:hypothetical protein [Pseudoalteromonas rubra]|uniref:hypothetical protein n=1 Tax=Pseudoalteromonas rubra TaxID=43658 RepID=UPI0013DE48E7|nr:hypothetical protein [Pseudoalteromonas rubra]